jgi:hypothetical protein
MTGSVEGPDPYFGRACEIGWEFTEPLGSWVVPVSAAVSSVIIAFLAMGCHALKKSDFSDWHKHQKLARLVYWQVSGFVIGASRDSIPPQAQFQSHNQKMNLSP